MDFSVLKPEIQKFIHDNIGADASKLAFQKNPFPDENWIEILNQVSAKTKARSKLPAWFSASNIIYPSKVSLEQTSSEKTAEYKAGIVSGKNLIDLTGGFGIDDFYFSKKMESVIHCEINQELSAIAAHNFRQLSANNIRCIWGDGTEILQNLNARFDWIYIDPSRRNDMKGKVFMLKDCFPNVPELLDLYFSHTDNILIKTAPILDISAGLTELRHVRKIHIVAVENEVRELNWELSAEHSGAIEIKTINLDKKTERFDFILGRPMPALIGLPKKYLYEPNSAIMKSGGFDEIGLRYGLEKLHQHSHLYTSDEKVEFPGRRFEVVLKMPYDKNSMKTLEGKKLNITVRNFPESVENIRKKWKIKDGGNEYSFFTTDANNHKIVLLCTKI